MIQNDVDSLTEKEQSTHLLCSPDMLDIVGVYCVNGAQTNNMHQRKMR